MTERGTFAGDGSGRKTRYHLLTADGGIVADQPGKMAGEAAIGVVLKAPLEEISEAIGPAKDHHVAEYRALIRGLEAARSRGIGHLRVCLDSALLVNQLNGEWKVKAEHLKPFQRSLFGAHPGRSRPTLNAISIVQSASCSQSPILSPSVRRRRCARSGRAQIRSVRRATRRVSE
jgi:ribonuclease HI